MKVLRIDGYIKLPDDFDGTLTDALEYYLNYRKEKGFTGNKIGRVKGGQIGTTSVEKVNRDNAWETFWELTNTTDKIAIVNMSVTDYSDPQHPILEPVEVIEDKEGGDEVELAFEWLRGKDLGAVVVTGVGAADPDPDLDRRRVLDLDESCSAFNLIRLSVA